MVENLFDLPAGTPADELFETIARGRNVRVERIVSHGHASPAGFWYDQEQAEFVVLLCGGARLEFEDREGSIELRPGDYLTIAAHRRHRVEWTAPDEPTIWLAVFFD